MTPDLSVLVLRLAVVGGLYLFLLAVVIVVAQDLGRGGRATAVEQTRRRGRLIVVGADAEVPMAERTFDLQPTTSIGRDPTCVVTVPDSFVSATHALLSWKDGRWWIEDLGSTNGTLLNNRAVKAPSPVAYSDVIQVGRVRLKLTRE